jgi:hypothetical protein
MTDHPEAPEIPARLPIEQADPKPPWRSRTIVAAVAIVAVQVLTLFGVGVDAGALTEALMHLGTAIAGGIAIWGRIRAEQPISPLTRRAAAD